MTPAQLAALKTHILANTNTVTFGGTPTQIKDVPNTGDGNYAVAEWYNATTSPAYRVWDTAVPLKTVRGLVDLSKFTPSDNPPASTNTVTGTNDALLYQNRALKCQLQQANAVFLIQGEGSVDCSALRFRQSFNDCLTLIPSGAGGANQNAGWGTSAAPGAVRLAMQRAATNAEKLFAVASTAAPNAGNVGADPRGGTTNPDTLVFVGGVSPSDVNTALNLP